MRSPRTYEYCSKNLSGCNVFSSTVFRYLKKKHSNEKVFFVHISSVFEARLKLIAASITWIRQSITQEYLPCLYTRGHGEFWDTSLTFTTATLAVNIASPGCAIAGAHRAAVHRISTILARHGPNQLPGTYYMRLYHDLVEFLRAWCVVWRLQWGARRHWKGAECWMTQTDCEGLLRLNPGFNHIWRYSSYRIFGFVGAATQVESVRTAFFYSWAMQLRWILLPDEGSLDVAPNPVFMAVSYTHLTLPTKA